MHHIYSVCLKDLENLYDILEYLPSMSYTQGVKDFFVVSPFLVTNATHAKSDLIT